MLLFRQLELDIMVFIVSEEERRRERKERKEKKNTYGTIPYTKKKTTTTWHVDVVTLKSHSLT